MAELSIDVEAQIENLRALKGDLEEHHRSLTAVVGADAGRRQQIAYAIRQIRERSAALEDLMRDRRAGRVIVTDLRADEGRRLAAAVDLLGREIPKGGPHGALLAAIRAVLGAADDVGLAVARGQPVGAESVHAAPGQRTKGAATPRLVSLVRDGT